MTMLQLGNIPSNVANEAPVSLTQVEICATVAVQPAVEPQDGAPPADDPAPPSAFRSWQTIVSTYEQSC
jgi:hypothetical protein